MPWKSVLGIRKLHQLSVTMLCTVAISGPTMWAAGGTGAITGVVKDASGAPLAGAIVKLKNTDKGITTTVISQAKGRYKATELAAGKYSIRATGGGLQSENDTTLDLSDNKTLTANVVLIAPQSFKEASTASHDMSLLPEGDGKAFIRSKCGLCHRNGFQEIILSRKDQDGWKQTLDKMRNHPYGYSGSLDITDQERDTLSEYLAANLGKTVPPLDTKANLPKSWVTGAAMKATVVEFDLPKGSYPHDVGVDSQGIVWVSERDLGYIGRLDPATFAYTRVKVPGEKVQLSDAIAIDRRDHSWVIDAHNSTAFEYNPETKAFVSYPYKPAGGPNRTISANTMRFLSDGSAWFTEVGASKVGKLDPATKQFTEYTPPSTAKTGAKTGPYGMAVDHAGIIWFPEELGDKVGKIDPKTGEITEYEPPTPGSIPRRMGTDAEGNPWFSEYGASNLVKIDYRTGKMTEYPTPTKYAGPYGVEADMKHNLIWVSECLADQMARFDPRTKSWTEYALPDHYLSVRKISVDPRRPTRVWFGEPFKDRVGYIEVAE